MTSTSVLNHFLREIPWCTDQVVFWDQINSQTVPKGKMTIIDIETYSSQNVGHFSVVDRRNPKVDYFFGPYGLDARTARRILNMKYRENADINVLTKILTVPYSYNHIDWQSIYLPDGEADNLCGVYSLLYCLNEGDQNLFTSVFPRSQFDEELTVWAQHHGLLSARDF